MRARKERLFRPGADRAGDQRLRDDIEADVFELWVGVSRLMSRLREPYVPFKIGRRPAQRRRTAGPHSRSV
jgi:hypothetical protein